MFFNFRCQIIRLLLSVSIVASAIFGVSSSVAEDLSIRTKGVVEAVPLQKNAKYSKASQAVGRVANIQAHTEEELIRLMNKAGEILESGEGYPQSPAAVFLLHGPEVQFFRKSNFAQYRSLVEKAAQLDALNIIDVRVCELYLQSHQINKDQLPAFVETVSNGPQREKELLQQGYVHF